MTYRFGIGENVLTRYATTEGRWKGSGRPWWRDVMTGLTSSITGERR
jgi:hypothetical protein